MRKQSILNRFPSFLLFMLLANVAYAQTRQISVAAGTGTAGFSGDGGQANGARIDGPSDVAIDPAGNFYIADRNNHRVRKVDLDSAVISTVAGSGNAGWFFSGGPARFASLDHPSGIALDDAGNLYVADLLDNDISRIHVVSAASGNITRIQIPVILSGAVAIALDSNGGLYISEEAGHRIRKVSISSGEIHTVAGTGVPGFSGDGGPATSAQINSPAHLTIDASGNIYFADTLNNRIRKVTADGIISTVAGGGPSGGPGGFSGDGGAATSAELNHPRGVAVDAAGNVLIADTLNKRIRKVNVSSGVITTVAGGPESGCAEIFSFVSPESVVVNPSGNFIYVADYNGNRIWKVTLDPSMLPPALTGIAPPNGMVGTTVAVTLTGRAFVGGGATSALTCRPNGTTVFIDGAGVTISNVNVLSETSLKATLTIAPGAELGPRAVTVTTDGGTSTAVQFTVAAAPLPVPTLTSIAPPNGIRESSATFTLSGTNFDARTGFTTVTADGGISVSDVRVINANSLTATFSIAGDAPLGNHSVAVVTPGGTSNAAGFAVQPQGPTFVYGLPQTLNPTEQTPVQLALANALPDPVTGNLTLTFVPNAVNPSDDPNVMFINSQASSRTMHVTFPANTATAELSLPSSLLEAGTVAGTIQLSMGEVQVGGMVTTPAGGDFGVDVPRLVPIITNLRVLNRTSAGFDVEVTGYSTSREITVATFSFGASSGANLLTVQLQPDVASSFGTYYQSEVSGTVGGAFVYLQPFLIQQGDVDAVASVTVTLTNAQGVSQPSSAPVE